MQTRIKEPDFRNSRAARFGAEPDIPESDQLDAKEKQKRGDQWRRTMLVAEHLMGAPHGLAIEELARRINDRMGTDYHGRTIYRDVELLASLGLAERRSGRAHWCPHQHGLVRAVLSSVTMPDPDRAPRRPKRPAGDAEAVQRRPSAVQAAIEQLPPPWELTERQMRAANEAARILAMIDHGDTVWVDAVLIYQLGAGWQLRRPGTDAPSRHAFASAISTEEQIDRAEEAINGILQDEWAAYDGETWELPEEESRKVRRVPR